MPSFRPPCAALVIVLVALAAPASASAATFCVHLPDGCAGTASSTVGEAVAAAAATPERDRIEVGAHAGATGEHFTIAAGNALDVVGIGNGATILADGALVVQEPSAVIRGVHVVALAPAGATVDLQAGTLAGSAVEAVDAASAVRLGPGATLAHDAVYGYGAGGAGVRVAGAGATISDSYMEGDAGLVVEGGDATLTRSHVTGASAAVRVTAGALSADDALMELHSGAAAPVAVDVAPAAPATVALRSTTVVGVASGTGLRTRCAGAPADVTLTDTVALGAALDLDVGGAGCVAHLDHSVYGHRDGTFDDGAGVVGGAPDVTWYADRLPGPSWRSALRDAGGDRPAAAGETDILGRPRVVDGRRDIGAVEYQHRAPVAGFAGPASGPRLSPVRFDALGTTDDDLDALTFAWSVDGAAVAEPFGPGFGSNLPFLEARFDRAGVHEVALTVTDESGLSSATTRTVTIAPDAATAGASAGDVPPATPPVPTAAPAVAHVAFVAARRAVRVGASGRAPVALRCAAGARCAGTLLVSVRHGSARVPAGSASFAVGAGGHATVRVALSSAARRELRRRHRLTLEARAYLGDGPAMTLGATATLKVARA